MSFVPGSQIQVLKFQIHAETAGKHLKSAISKIYLAA